MPAIFTVQSNPEENKTTLTLSGRLDTGTSPQLQEKLEELLAEGTGDIILDLSDLEYISSAGLRVLLMGEKKCRLKDRKQVVKGANASILEIFDITGFSGVLTVE